MLKILKMTKPQLQEECKKQNLECENKSVAEMQVLLIGDGQPAGMAQPSTSASRVRPVSES